MVVGEALPNHPTDDGGPIGLVEVTGEARGVHLDVAVAHKRHRVLRIGDVSHLNRLDGDGAVDGRHVGVEVEGAIIVQEHQEHL